MQKNDGTTRSLIFLGCFLLCLLFYGVFLFPHYAYDTYIVVKSPTPDVTWTWENYGALYTSNGRFTSGLLMCLLAWMGIHPLPTGLFSHLLSILMMAASLFLFFQYVRRFFSTQIGQAAAFLCSAFVFCNPFFADWFHYTENTPYYCAGLLGMVVAARLYFAKERLSWRLGLACLFLVVLCAGIYQTLLSFFVLFALVFALLLLLRAPAGTPGDMVKRYLATLAPAGGMYIGATLVQLIVRKLLSGSRSNFMLWENLRTVLYRQPELWLLRAVGIDNVLFAAFFLCGLVCLLLLCFRKRKDGWLALLVLVSWGILLLAIFATHIVAEPWLSHRTTVAFPAQLAFCWLPCLALLEEGKPAATWITKGCCLAAALMLAIFGYATARLGMDIIRTNTLDAQIARSIEQLISTHEEETGTPVTKAALVYDQQITHAYPGTVAYYDLNIRAWTVPWAALNMMQFYTGRKLAEVEAPEDIKWLMYQEDWHEYSDEQVLLQGDTAYICVY